MRQSSGSMNAELGLLFTKSAPRGDTGPSCAVEVCIMNNIILTLGGLFSLSAVSPAFSAEFPLGANDFDAWKEATAQAMELDFLTTSSQDVRALFGEPRTVGDSDYDDTYVYSYYCPINLPQLQRLRQVYPQNQRERIWILLEFKFYKKDDKLMRVQLVPFESPIPIPEAG